MEGEAITCFSRITYYICHANGSALYIGRHNTLPRNPHARLATSRLQRRRQLDNKQKKSLRNRDEKMSRKNLGIGPTRSEALATERLSHYRRSGNAKNGRTGIGKPDIDKSFLVVAVKAFRCGTQKYICLFSRHRRPILSTSIERSGVFFFFSKRTVRDSEEGKSS